MEDTAKYIPHYFCLNFSKSQFYSFNLLVGLPLNVKRNLNDYKSISRSFLKEF